MKAYYEQRLLNLGVPPNLAMPIADMADDTGHKRRTAIEMACVLIPIGIAWLVMSNAESLLTERARQLAIANDAKLFSAKLGLEVVPLMFLAIGVGACLWTAVLTRQSDSKFAAALMFDAAGLAGRFNRYLLKRGVAWANARSNSDTEPHSFLRNVASRFMMDAAALSAIIALIAIAVFVIWPPKFGRTTPTGIIETPILPWSKERRVEFADAVKLTSGCAVLKDGTTLIYRLETKDGSTISFNSWRSVSAGQRTAALIEISKQLPRSIEHIRFSNLVGTDPLDPRCIRYFSEAFSPPSAEKVLDLLRADATERKHVLLTIGQEG